MRADTTEEPSATDSGLDKNEIERVQRAIKAGADDVKKRELQTAFDRLEGFGSVTPEQRQIISQMATAIVDGILAAPNAALDDTVHDEGDTVKTAIEFFDIER